MIWQRLLTGVILIPVVVLLVLYAPLWLFAMATTLVAILALWEFFALGDEVGHRPYRRWTIFCSLLLAWFQFAAGPVESRALSGGIALVRRSAWPPLGLETVLLVFLFGLAALTLLSRGPLVESAPRAAISSLGLLAVIFPFTFIIRLGMIPRSGRVWVLFLLLLTWAGDTAALLVGKAIGRLRFAPRISPKKTWEGAAANLLAAMLVGLLFARFSGESLGASAFEMVSIAAAANIAGQAGDLFESAFKRGAGVKDSGSLLPGHGGMLDRIDSLILAAPVLWCYLAWMGFGRF
jgi:phosphatidate cytidylyltransferase